VIFLPRAKNAKAEIALKLYRQGKLLKDIAEELEVPQGTVRRWKSEYGWDGEGVRKNNERSEKRSQNNERSERTKKENLRKAVAEDVRDVCGNEKLTDKQRLFCLYYVKYFNATKAYQKAYECSYETACGNGSAQLKKIEIQAEIQRLKQNRMNREMLTAEDLFQKYMDIAFADMTGFVDFGSKEVTVTDPNTGAEHTEKVNYVSAKDSNGVDGTLISEITCSNGEIRIKLADRMKALEWLSTHMDSAPEDMDTSYVDALKELATRAWDDEDDGEEESESI
jgi:phage terminase small subunit